MDGLQYRAVALFEHRFWLQVLGDHARFILNSLAPRETQDIQCAGEFVGIFDQLLGEARHPLTDQQLIVLTERADRYATEIRAYKLYLLSRHLVGELSLNLPPTFLNHMVNEVEVYLKNLSHLLVGQVPPLRNPVDHHLIWLLDAVGHAQAINDSVDGVEHDLKEQSADFMVQFGHLHDKSLEMAGYLRTNLCQFPALSRLNLQAEQKMLMFVSFLHEIGQLEISKQLLGTLFPLMPDHMLREECYYLTKLAEVSEVMVPNCDPTRPRIEV